MPNNKGKKNSFYFYLKEVQSRLEEQGRRCNMNDETLIGIADSEWRYMDTSERKKYVDLAAEDKKARQEQRVEKGKVVHDLRDPHDNPMLGNVQQELDAIERVIDKRTIRSFPFIVGSSNIFFRNKEYCLPAEVGFVKFTFQDGILEKYHSFIHHQEYPIEQMPNMKQHAEKNHQIYYYDNLTDQESTEYAIEEIHRFIHLGNYGTKAYVLVDKEEYQQMVQVFDWLKKSSNTLGLSLVWNVEIWKLSTLYVYVNQSVLDSKGSFTLSESYFAFKRTLFLWNGLCRYHDLHVNRNCALAEAHNYTYILCHYFCESFEIEKIVGKHFPAR